MGSNVSLDFLISLKEKLDSWRDNYNEEYLKKLSDEEANEYNLMTTIKEEILLEKAKKYFGDISLKEIETKLEREIKRRNKQKRDEYFDKVIPLKEQFDKDKSNTVLLDQISMIFASYYTNVVCITESAILSMIDSEIKVRQIKAQSINRYCEQTIADLERKISNPEGYMEDELWKTRNFYNEKGKLAVDLDSHNNVNFNKEDITYSLKGSNK